MSTRQGSAGGRRNRPRVSAGRVVVGVEFRVTFRKEPEGGYTALVSALPGCVTWGQDMRQAHKQVRDAITGYLDCLIRRNRVRDTIRKCVESLAKKK